MTYKYSICHPDKPDIEYPAKVLESSQVIELVKGYPWVEILKSVEAMPDENIHYSPSLDFTSTKDNHSFCLTAQLENQNLEFSIWYNRPVKYKVLFGLFGEKTAMRVIDKWGFDMQSAIKNLEIFLNQDYATIENMMKK